MVRVLLEKQFATHVASTRLRQRSESRLAGMVNTLEQKTLRCCGDLHVNVVRDRLTNFPNSFENRTIIYSCFALAGLSRLTCIKAGIVCFIVKDDCGKQLCARSL